MRRGFVKEEGLDKESSGILVIDKPGGMTSFNVDSRIKKELKCLKVGHAGTLDPFATGVLPVLINKATKIQDRLINLSKSYEGTFEIGVSTNTLDISGEVLDNKVADISEIERIVSYLNGLKGDFIQKIPAFSAKKVNGVPLYKYARKKISPGNGDFTNTVNIYEFNISSYDSRYINFSCTVSKGTYLRAIAQDIMDKFDIPARLYRLRRTSAGGFDISQAVTLDSVLQYGKDFALENIIKLKDLEAIRQ